MRFLFPALVLAAAAHLTSGANAGPTGIPGEIVDTPQAENPLLPCYMAQRRLQRLGPRQGSSPMSGLNKTLTCGLKWVALEPNSPQTTALAQRRIDELLNRMWRDRNLQGQRPSDAYFVTCGQGVATQTELEQGLLVCLVGAAPSKPGEFEISRVATRTADSP